MYNNLIFNKIQIVLMQNKYFVKYFFRRAYYKLLTFS